MAGYGLAALIGGGAAAAAVKTGFLQKAWKVIVALVFAAIAGHQEAVRGGASREEPAASVQPPPVSVIDGFIAVVWIVYSSISSSRPCPERGRSAAGAARCAPARPRTSCCRPASR